LETAANVAASAGTLFYDYFRNQLIKNMKKLAMIFLMLFTVAYVNSVFAQDPGVVVSDKPGWHKIGEVKADFKTEDESIVVLGKDEFKSIKLKVTDAPIDISQVVVYYESGETQKIPVTGMLAAGSESKIYDLQYPSKELKKVSFTYKSEPNYKSEKAHVELYGLK
jgi:hypothetical protein